MDNLLWDILPQQSPGQFRFLYQAAVLWVLFLQPGRVKTGHPAEFAALPQVF
jgi:hypothetical protein